ncbi:MAG: protease inhibitor I42 family protein [Dehalococcoidia bacterium]|nr:protease inhibitor I42 family protein [Dehalococcoidia bacterium]
MKTKLIVIAGMITTLLVAGACSAANTNAGSDLVGWIDSAQQSQGETPGMILVNSPDDKTSDKFMVTVTDQTEIFRQAEGKQQKAVFSSFNAGQKVEIWFSSPVMESYPAQVSAAKIVFTEVASYVALIEISYDEFMSQQHITKELEINHPGSLTVSLASNPTTGFQWEEVKISDEELIYQTEHNFISPQDTGVVGASGKDVWSFKTLDSGTSNLIFEYSRPWENGEKDEWTFALTLVVK